MIRTLPVKYFMLLLLSVSFLAGCKAWKKTPKEMPEEDAEMKKVQTLIQKSHNANLQYEWLSGKIAGEINTNGRKYNFKANLRMKKDSVIWISVSYALGFEIARMKLTPDTLLMINRLNKTYHSESYASISRLIGMDVPFESFQDMLTGNMPLIEAEYNWESDTLDNMNVIRDKAEEHSGQVYQKSVIQEFRLDPETFKLRKVRIEQLKPQNRLVSFEYYDFQTIPGNSYPAIIEAVFFDGSRTKLQMTYKSMEYGEKLRFPFSISSKYDRIPLRE